VHADIPPLHVITAMSDADDEDFVAQLLHSQGWHIGYRAVEWESAKAAIASLTERSIFIYSSDVRGFLGIELAPLVGENLIAICIDDVPIAAHPLMTCIRERINAPQPLPSRAQPVSTANSSKRSVLVTGTSGAPGRSALALALAQEFAITREVELIDADIHSQSLEYLAGDKELTPKLQLSTLNLAARSPVLPESDVLLRLIDIGALPPLADVLSDRRWQGALMHSSLMQSQCILYIAQSDGLGLLRLEKFIQELPLLMTNVPVLFILNQVGATRLDKALSERFVLLMDGRAHFTIPYEMRGGLISSLAKNNSGLWRPREIAKIAALITSQLR
jgi:hypothetical protein